MNSKNNNTKKNLYLAYCQGNMIAYPPTNEAMARYLSTQYPKKNSVNQREGKKGDRNRKKVDNLGIEDKDSNTAGTLGAHIGDTTPPEDSTASSGGDSVGAQVLESNK